MRKLDVEFAAHTSSLRIDARLVLGCAHVLLLFLSPQPLQGSSRRLAKTIADLCLGPGFELEAEVDLRRGRC